METLEQQHVPKPRSRRVAIGPHGNALLMDPNGNRRLSSLTEMSVDDPDADPENVCKHNAIGNGRTDNFDASHGVDLTEQDSVFFDSSLLQQINMLIQKVKVDDTLANYVNQELHGQHDINGNIRKKVRRKSCFTIGLNGHLSDTKERVTDPFRRVSVTSSTSAKQKAKSLPRRRESVITCTTSPPLDENRNVYDPTTGRRLSVMSLHHPHRRISNTSATGVRSRRCSVQHSGANASHSYLRRRMSLAHAYQNSAMPPLRRLSQSNHQPHPIESGTCHIMRRNSSVKPPCFPVTKLACVQKRLNQLYRRRKRGERAEINVNDVKRAFRNIRKAENNGKSDSEVSEVNDDDTSTNKDIANECADIDIVCCQSEAAENNPVAEDEESNVDCGPVPTPRRKTSIQVRAWELSRKVRQKRREKRKGYNESPLI
ncbi:uncharacterized protein LOC127835671 [Dreissena polymorpha]|uniref:Uncharacterized protein n=1 Tax=Dreissena polymorpha TaxID=45954 RepID=A0A9D4MXJ8_DREPO|nr:uncharacterized protein LOC127835671 [Dreissena polymorpha]KAH3884035.1 hypothetical protein DPMN_008005 [Dreissena polymorpha]